MSNFLKEGEQLLEGQGGGNDQSNNQSSNDQSNYGQSGNNQSNYDQSSSNQQSSSSGGGLLSNLESSGEDAMINSEINSVATKEGIPQSMDGAIDAFADKEL